MATCHIASLCRIQAASSHRHLALRAQSLKRSRPTSIKACRSTSLRWAQIRSYSDDAGDVAANPPRVVATVAAVEPLFERLVAEQHVKGVVLGLVAGEEVGYIQYGGFLQGLLKVPQEASLQLSFEIGSITKAVTGLALASLIEAGKVRLDTTLGECLPELQKNPRIACITLVQLATHTSGLPALPSDLLNTSTNDNPYAKYSAKDVLANLSKLDDLVAPGERYLYSNYGAGILGMALVRVSGARSFDALLKDTVLNHFLMENTSTSLRLTTVGHNESLEPVPAWTFDALQAAGALRSTPADMMKLLYAMANPNTTPLANVIEAATKKIIETPRGVALGWHVGLHDHPDVIWHNGSTGGYSSIIAVHQPTHRGVVLLSNTSTEMIMRASNFVLSTLLEKPTEPFIHDYYAEEIPVELMELYPGMYRKDNLSIEVKVRGGNQLWIKLPQYPATRAFPETPFRFHLRSLGAVIDFEGWDPDLPPHTLVYSQGETKIETTRDGQEFRKFLKNTKNRIGRLFGRTES